jgi:hypothetical protein
LGYSKVHCGIALEQHHSTWHYSLSNTNNGHSAAL